MAISNILIDETKKYFNYDPVSLKPSSEKMVFWFCDTCNCKLIKKFRLAVKNSNCINCSNKTNANKNKKQRSDKLKKWHSEHTHPLKGTKRPDYIVLELEKGRKKANEINRSEIGRANLSNKNSGENNPMYNKKHTKEAIDKMIEFQKTNQAIRGVNSNFFGKPPKHGKGNWYKCLDGSEVWLRSSWEYKYAEYLDNNNIRWLYEPKKYKINYNNKIGTYCPDFYLIDENKYIEIKGWWRDDAYAKFIAFKEQYKHIIIELFDKAKLKEIGIKL